MQKKIFIGIAIAIVIWVIWYLFFRKTKAQALAASFVGRKCLEVKNHVSSAKAEWEATKAYATDAELSDLVSGLNRIYTSAGYPSFGNPDILDREGKISIVNRFMADAEKYANECTG